MFPLLIVSIVLLSLVVLICWAVAVADRDYTEVAFILTIVCTIPIVALSLALSNLP